MEVLDQGYLSLDGLLSTTEEAHQPLCSTEVVLDYILLVAGRIRKPEVTW